MRYRKTFVITFVHQGVQSNPQVWEGLFLAHLLDQVLLLLVLDLCQPGVLSERLAEHVGVEPVLPWNTINSGS